jgi:hypothetical protein
MPEDLFSSSPQLTTQWFEIYGFKTANQLDSLAEIMFGYFHYLRCFFSSV